jgi:hypothetical protein
MCHQLLQTEKYTKAIRKVTSSELLTKQTMEKILYTKNMYIIKLLLNTVTARIAALGTLENKLLYACIKEACELSHILMPSINSPLLLKRCDLQVSKQGVVAWSEIRAVRRAAKQLPVEML